MDYKPENDGIDHINVYSKGKTELGRLLSNFAHTPFDHPVHGRFKCVEGFWYFTMTGDERFKTLSGWLCKKEGELIADKKPHPTVNELKVAYKAKLKSHPKLYEMLRENKLPLTHYYVYGNKVVPPTQWLWTAELWNELINE